MIVFPINVEVDLVVNNSVYEAELVTNQVVFDTDLVTVIQTYGNVPVYEGDYVITPSAHNQQVLETKDKLLEENVTVLKIPTSETHNQYGLTFYIGEVS